MTEYPHDPTSLILRHTRVTSLPLLPELRLRLASDVFPLWREMEGLPGQESPMPYWAFAWSGGQALARFVLDHPESVACRTVLDLGAGSGIVAIAAVLSGAGHVRTSEVDPIALAAMTMNADLNGVGLEPLPDDLLDGRGTPDEVILAGDLFYEREMASRVLGFLELCREGGAMILAGDPGREFFPKTRFRQIASYDVPVMTAVEDGDTKTVGVWEAPANVPKVIVPMPGRGPLAPL